jgi:hypothetical protein
MPITARHIRYLKLGRGGIWENVSLDRGELHFGHAGVPHELGLEANRERIKQFQIEKGRDPSAASEDAREIVDFYRMGSDCLWVTFARDHLWWAFAEPEVAWLGVGQGRGERVRKAIGGWQNTDANGKPLRMDSLSTKLTKVASYRRTLCSIESKDYLLRRLNGEAEPLVEKASLARDALVVTITEAVESLHWADFETLVDIIFSRSGWHRASAIGGTQKLVDLVVDHPVTGEHAAVQVKSSANQKTLQDFISLADETGVYDRLFFVCHSPRGKLVVSDERADIHVWSGGEIAQMALRVGLADWIIEKIS